MKLNRIIKNNKFYFLRLLKIFRVLKLININLQHKVLNRKWIIPVSGGTGMHNLINSEPWMLNLLKKIDQDNSGVFIDVGVNIGQTIIAINSINEKIEYIGFEPNINCVSYSQKLITLNSLCNFSIYPFGLSDKVKIETLFADNETASGASLLENFRIKYNKRFLYHVPVFPYDDLHLQKKPGIIKIDVEGYELEAIQGMQSTLTKYKPVIICEVLPVYDKLTTNGAYRFERQEKLVRILNEMGYNIFLINEDNLCLHYLDKLPIHGDMNKTNYVFAHCSNPYIYDQLDFK